MEYNSLNKFFNIIGVHVKSDMLCNNCLYNKMCDIHNNEHEMCIYEQNEVN